MIIPTGNRNLLLDVCAATFGIASWISINGIWVELPLMVSILPEQWALASYLSVIVQVANLGPISYSVIKWKWPSLPKSLVIYPVLLVGILASIFLAMFWDRTTYISGKETSTALFTLVFFLSLVDCTSSVLFMPFMVSLNLFMLHKINKIAVINDPLGQSYIHLKIYVLVVLID